ncbi:multi-sensor hybrid histidine kinase [Leptothrix cholodnii SP-6]|uniref:Sensory/regulatory protein RpfC n=1 Tax=Leptothrix cholodnii (strain ATCC 51168 / LMG 8142 / SP-6) TaxID=395495 RepID=B1XWI2_LEPCP|nr:response regulator [Leptothrix cholodnii]ACB34983.1 multi-sensor hybrid histidine kinase [Leptothrix cholodnii SP-6]
MPANVKPVETLTPDLLWRLARAVSSTSRLLDAMTVVAPSVARALGAQGVGLVQVMQWRPASSLVQPWGPESSTDDEWIDLAQLVLVEAERCPLGRALSRGQVEYGAVGVSPQAWNWRAPGVRQVLVLPVLTLETPDHGPGPVAVAGLAASEPLRPTLAALEFHDPDRFDPEVLPLLGMLALQLAAVARREADLQLARQRDEQLAQVAMLASRTGRSTVITDQNGRIEWVHPAFAEITGHLPLEVQGRPLWEALARDLTRSDAAAQLRTLFAGSGAFRHEFVARRGQACAEPGQPYWLEVDAAQVIDETTGRLQFVCLCSDISSRKAHESGNDEQRELLAALTENLPISLLVLDAQRMQVLSLNRHAQIEFGVSPTPGNSGLDDMLGAGLHERIRAELDEVLQRPGAVEHEFVWPTVEGRRVISARHVAVQDRHGPPRVVITQLRDVTRQRRDELRLRESETRYRELVETIDEGVFISNPARDQWYYIGPRMYQMLGLKVADRREHPDLLQSLVLPDDARLLAQQREHEEALEATDVTLRIRHPGRGLRWLRQRTRTRVLPGGETRVYGLLDDVTDERERALQLQAARDVAEAASQAKSQFMASMSHEIRTPMNGILGMTELLLGTRLDDRQRRFAQAVYRSGENLLEIINDVLDFSKIEAGRLELAPTDFNLRTLIEDTLDLLAPRAHEKGLELSFRETGDVPANVLADPLRLRQVLTNLVANAVKFTEHGEVTVDLRFLPRPRAGAPAMLEFRVRDTGIGMAAELLPRLFTAFTQAHGGMARRYGGTGLGLAISRQLVELMGGQIDVVSQPGVGSEFRFTMTFEPGSGRDSEAGELTALPQARVLVVEDHATNRTVLDHLLSAWGLSVTLAVDGQAALELLRNRPADQPDFDIALVDWRMPRLDGIGFAKALRAEGLAPGTQLVMLSSASAPDDARLAQDAGFVRFIHKPVRKAELRQAILGVTASRGVEPVDAQVRAQVLVVEDNPVNQEVMGQMLHRLGCRVRVAGTALDGLRVLCEQPVDLVLMDIQMPGMDGIEALHWIRRGESSRFKLRTPANLPVVAVTANALDGDEERFLGFGFDAYLSKPYRQSQLLGILQGVVPGLVGTGLPADDSRAAPDPAPAPPGEATLRGGAPMLDVQALQRLRELDPGGRNRLLERVLKAFDASIGRMLTQLAEGQSGQDAALVRHVLHTLKSSSQSVGALALAQMCVDCEAQLRQGVGLDLLATRLNQLQLEMLRVQQGLHPYIEAQPA